jgi:hypothetical protein
MKLKILLLAVCLIKAITKDLDQSEIVIDGDYHADKSVSSEMTGDERSTDSIKTGPNRILIEDHIARYWSDTYCPTWDTSCHPLHK